jgi:DNA-binding NtrC family response regulator
MLAHAALVVEDDPLLAQAWAHRLTEWGLQVYTAANREQALAFAQPFLLALIDLGLPPRPDSPEEGLLLIELLSTQQPLLPVLVVTGQDEQQAAREAIARGAFDFLTKPVTPDALDAALTRACRHARVLRELAAQGAMPVGLSAHENRQGLREATDLAQEKLVRQTLAATGGNVSEAARRLGLERTRLYYYLDKFGIRPRANPSPPNTKQDASDA